MLFTKGKKLRVDGQFILVKQRKEYFVLKVINHNGYGYRFNTQDEADAFFEKCLREYR